MPYPFFRGMLAAGVTAYVALGPVSSGSAREPLQRGAVVIEGRFVDERGAPVSAADVEGSLDDWWPTFINVVLAPLEDDGNGGFRILLDAPKDARVYFEKLATMNAGGRLANASVGAIFSQLEKAGNAMANGIYRRWPNACAAHIALMLAPNGAAR